jgi:hypothetical protein
VFATIATVEAVAATAAFAALAVRYQETRTALRRATWRADTLAHLEERRIERAKRRAGIPQNRNEKGQFA